MRLKNLLVLTELVVLVESYTELKIHQIHFLNLHKILSTKKRYLFHGFLKIDGVKPTFNDDTMSRDRN